MTNTLKLQAKMKEKGFTITTLASKVGLSPTGLFNKIHNKKEFVVSEVQLVGEALCLDKKEIQDIFFG